MLDLGVNAKRNGSCFTQALKHCRKEHQKYSVVLCAQCSGGGKCTGWRAQRRGGSRALTSLTAGVYCCRPVQLFTDDRALRI